MTAPIRQGEVRALGVGSKLIVVSNDDANDDAYPIVVPVVRGRDDLPPYRIQLSEMDPLAGVAMVAWIGATDPRHLGEVVGMVTGATMERIREAIGELVSP